MMILAITLRNNNKNNNIGVDRNFILMYYHIERMNRKRMR
jgi:hypothetical protein